MPPPPPPPLFIGSTVSVRLEPTRASTPLLALRPHNGHSFSLPRGTSVLFLPPERLVAVSMQDLGEGTSSLTFLGEFSRVDRPEQVTLSPVSKSDAAGVIRVLVKRFGLPKRPVDKTTEELASCPRDELVRVIDSFQRGHPEGPNFGGIVLSPPPGKELVSGALVTAIGFVDPAVTVSPNMPPPLGWSGPRLRAVWVEVNRTSTLS